MATDTPVHGLRKQWWIDANDFRGAENCMFVGSGTIESNAELGLDDGDSAAATLEGGTAVTGDLVLGANQAIGKRSMGAQNPVFTEISTLNLLYPQFAATGDILTHHCLVPWDVDPAQSMGVRVVYVTGSSTAEDTIDWIVLADFIAEGGNLTAASTALDTAIAQDTITGALDCQKTARGIVDASFLTRAQVEAGAHVVLSVEMDAADVDLSGEGVWMLGVLIDYVPQRTKNPSAYDLSLTTS